MGNFNPKCDWHDTAMVQSEYIGTRSIRHEIWETIYEFENTYKRPPYTVEIAKDFYAKKSGFITGLWERSLMYAASPIIYVVMTVQAMHRMDILYSNSGCDQFSTKHWN